MSTMDICYPSVTDWTGNETFRDELPQETLELMEALAWNQLAALLGYSLAICPITIRPCSQSYADSVWKEAREAGGGFQPYLNGGAWVNSCGCGGSACECGGARFVFLPSPVGSIDSIIIDGEVLDPGAYRVDNHSTIVREDGGVWPTGQDFSKAAGEDGTWSVRYFHGDGPDDLSRWAAGILAWEFAKASTGKGKCRLPAGVTQVTRMGVSMEMRNSLFLDGTTGIREIDMFISQRNPHQLTQPTRIKSPDSGRSRQTTWRA